MRRDPTAFRMDSEGRRRFSAGTMVVPGALDTG